MVNKKDIILEAGDYIIIEPGEIVNLQQEIIEDVEGITIKTPSRYGDTIKKSSIEKRVCRWSSRLVRGDNSSL